MASCSELVALPPVFVCLCIRSIGRFAEVGHERPLVALDHGLMRLLRGAQVDLRRVRFVAGSIRRGELFVVWNQGGPIVLYPALPEL